MIAKCVALLAVVAQINGYVCNSQVVASGCGASGIVGSGLVGSSGLVGTSGIVGSGLVGSSGLVGTSGTVGSAGLVGSPVVVGSSSGAVAQSRNIVAKGKYPVALENTGPVPDSRVPVSTSYAQAPVQEKPTVRLPARIPAPRTVAHSCTCYKQILRPRVHEQYITVPSVQRYIETTHTPVVENIHYEAVPVNSPSSGANSEILLGGQLSSGSLQLASSSLPVSAAVEAVPVSSGFEALSAGYGVSPVASTVQAIPVSSVQAVPVASTVQAVPVASPLQVASSVPVRSLSSGCESQGYFY